MTYRSMLVNFDIDGPVEPIARLAIDLARRCNASLIGFCAADAPLPAITAPECGSHALEIWEQTKDEIKRKLNELRREFEDLVGGSVESSWHEAIDSPTRSLSTVSGLADLVIMSTTQGAQRGNAYRAADPGSVVLQAGRPILFAATGAEDLLAKRVVIAWKDLREARRAVADAIPLLLAAGEVLVVTVDPEQDDRSQGSLQDVQIFLAAHQIQAQIEVLRGRDEGQELLSFLKAMRADLIVSGAYGQSRFREWVFGGVTRSLLDEVGLNRLMSN